MAKRTSTSIPGKARAFPLLAVIAAGDMLAGCTTYYPSAPPPPAGSAGENWARHVVRCERHYPRYDPRTDLIYRANGTFSCPL